MVKMADTEKQRLPIHTLESIVCFGNVMCSPHALSFCSERNVSVSFLTEYGKFLARVSGPVSGNVLLRRQQYRMADDPFLSACVARNMISAKIMNARSVISRTLRDHTSDNPAMAEVLQAALSRLKGCAGKVMREEALDIIRGVEGDAAREYFNVFEHLIVSQKEDFTFQERNRRPPRDKVNALLSFTYTILMHDVRSALETVGLDPAVGFLHRDRPGRYSLALDVMEEFRPFFADRLVLSLINLKQVNNKGFHTTEAGDVLMTDDTRKQLLISYQSRKQDVITHPFINEKVTIGRLFHIQAMLLARYIRGDIDGYPPFVWK